MFTREFCGKSFNLYLAIVAPLVEPFLPVVSVVGWDLFVARGAWTFRELCV